MKPVERYAFVVVLVLCATFVLITALRHLRHDLEATGWQAERDVALRAMNAAHADAARIRRELEAANDSVAARDSAIADALEASAVLGEQLRAVEAQGLAAVDSARTTSGPRDAFYERGIRALRAALDSAAARHGEDSTAIAGLTMQVATLRAAAPKAFVAITFLERNGEQLAAVARGGEPKCRLAKVLPCPTRTQAAIGGLVLGIAGTVAIAK